ncbi:ribonuclease III [Brumimicrobium aurantiacum]|uniref:ribonuclease III n=1 Tax=Brumimicrobium aurantiacum TaxID=1737063 RepID=UPI0014030FBC|nr:ribonuclease III [Brumimicrobium aurantiacum]
MKRLFSFRTSPKSKNDLKLIRFIIRKFGYRPRKLLHFKIALTHKSVSNTSDKLISNERLEFLGDTILDAIVADFLYNKFPDKDEGYLTKVKSKMVSRKTLTTIAQSMDISEHIIYQKGRNIRLATLEGNAFEALIGAIYLDGGYLAAKKSIFHSVLRSHLDLPTLLQNEIDFKSKLYIWSQKNRLDIEFKLLQEKFVDGKWHYAVEVFINKNPYGKGTGESKKIAEQAASKETLQLMGAI